MEDIKQEQGQEEILQGSNEEAKTFTQEELEEVISKRLAREKVKIEKAKESEMQARLKFEIEESEKLAKMTEAEKSKALAEKSERELFKARELFEVERKAFEQEKILNLTMKTLGEKGLPIEFASFIKTDNADSIMENLAIFEKGFKDAVDKGVLERLRGKTPISSNSNPKEITKDDFKRMSYSERLEIYKTNKELYDSLI